MILPLTTANARTPLFSVVDAERAAGQQLFADHCGACHGRAGVAAGYAPSLIGVVGRRAGSVAGFPYSRALSNSGIIWSEDNLVKWITNAPAMVPGTQMPHVSITDPAERLYVGEYLKTLSHR
jgi:cytochrome c